MSDASDDFAGSQAGIPVRLGDDPATDRAVTPRALKIAARRQPRVPRYGPWRGRADLDHDGSSYRAAG